MLTAASEKGSVKSWWTSGSAPSLPMDGAASPRPSTPRTGHAAAPSSATTGSTGTMLPDGADTDRAKGKENRDEVNESSGAVRPPLQSRLGNRSAAPVQDTSVVSSSETSGSASQELGRLTMRDVSNGFLVADEGALATELTRIEWELFRDIGPRDFLRHALVKPHERIPNGLVAQSISHFNYVSALIMSLILVQPKVKTRARMMEKIVRVAVRLRMCNNYNTLQAVLAGLSCGAVHRLRHTRALAQENKELHKRYLSLVRLMRTERASAAYRMALENSSGRIIPFIGVHLHDILSTADGNVSRRPSDGAVHWRKFSLLHDAIGTLTRAQRAGASAAPLEPHHNLTRLILNVPILDEEDAWQTSLAIEPKATTPAQTLLRKMQVS